MNKSEDHYNEKRAILEQYKIYVEMADRISQRRNSANVLFLSLNTFVAGWMSTSKEIFEKVYLQGMLWIVLLLLLVIVNYFWFRLIKSYRQLNTAKYKVIGEIEKKLPISPYWEMEWKELGSGRDPKLYSPLTSIEIIVPKILITLYTIVLTLLLFINNDLL